ncbi:MAG: glycosyltransferase [Hyphomonadaceae bacterium]
MNRKKILFFATEDWFLRSHFLPLLRRATADGFEVVVVARDSGALKDEPNLRLIGASFARRAVLPWELSRQVAELDEILATERPDIVHAIALKPIVLLLHSRLRRFARVVALTGRGYLVSDDSLFKRVVRARVRAALRRALTAQDTLLLAENEHDARWAGAGPRDFLLMPGAGVDPDKFTPAPEPMGPIVVGIVARLIKSKGIDIAVRAIGGLRAKGAEVTLCIGGAPDPENPEHYAEAEIARWRETPGVELLGRVNDVAAFWRNTHIACLPSRGGEGLPRTLLEAAACGRPIVTTEAPGCADFAQGIGLTAPTEDAPRLAQAIETLATDAALRMRLGARAREKVIAGYTETHAAAVASEAWRRVLSSSPARTNDAPAPS